MVSTPFERAELPALEAELSAAIARIDAGEFVPTPSEFTCAGCPALDLVCAGPRLGGGAGRRRAPVAAPCSAAELSSREARASASARSSARIGPIIERLAVEHADATIALTFASPLELLVSVMLSAQTTDVNVNRVTEKLFVKYRRPEDYLAVPSAELERDIFATGFYRQKAKALRGTMRMLIEEYDGEVPRAVRRPAPAAGRRAQDGERRLGRARQRAGDRRRHARAPALAAARPHEAGRPGEDRARPHAGSCRASDWARFPHLLIWHGRRICDAREPRCEDCPLAADLCPSSRDLGEPLPDVLEQLRASRARAGPGRRS